MGATHQTIIACVEESVVNVLDHNIGGVLVGDEVHGCVEVQLMNGSGRLFRQRRKH